MELKNKVALVTGGSAGIGRAAAIALSKHGISVIINYKSDKESANSVLAECNKFSEGNMTLKADIGNESEVRGMFEEIAKKYGSIGILINNAGIYDESDNLFNLKAFENVFSINLFGQVKVTKYALEIMKSGFASKVNLLI